MYCIAAACPDRHCLQTTTVSQLMTGQVSLKALQNRCQLAPEHLLPGRVDIAEHLGVLLLGGLCR